MRVPHERSAVKVAVRCERGGAQRSRAPCKGVRGSGAARVCAQKMRCGARSDEAAQAMMLRRAAHAKRQQEETCAYAETIVAAIARRETAACAI